MKKFSSIEQFRHVVKHVRYHYEFIQQPTPVLNFTGTVKLHGSNSGVSRTNGVFSTQSREREITIDDDNYGFANFINSLSKNKLNELFDKVSSSMDVTIFGEWVGQGIQKNVAVSKLPKHFVIFSVWDNVANKYLENNKDWRIEELNIFNILQIPTYSVTIDFAHPENIIETLEKYTLEVEKECPWGKKFGISSIGEGIVWTCLEHPEDSRLWFKTKGEKHCNKGDKDNKKHIANVSPEKLNTINEVVEYVLPEWRLQQGITVLQERGVFLDMKAISEYLKWIGQDVKKEEMDTITNNGLEWKDISNNITLKAKNYYINEFNKL